MRELPDLFREDGIKLAPAGREFKCLCPFHEERTPSCYLFHKAGRWGFFCFGCQAGGDDVVYLTKARGISKKEALRLRDGSAGQGGGKGENSRKSTTRSPARAQYQWIDDLPDRFAARYVYRNAAGKTVFVVQRYYIEDRKTGEKIKVPVPYTRARKGKGGPLKWIKGLPIAKDRPLYRLVELGKADHSRQVMVVEGEKCADMVAIASSRTVVTTWAGGANAWHKTDWTPLHGRPLLLVADGNEVGHRAMERIADHLAPDCPNIVIVRPPLPAEGEKARDIGDEIEAKTDISRWLKNHAAPHGAPTPPRMPIGKGLVADNPHFCIEGKTDDGLLVKGGGGKETFECPRSFLLGSGGLALLAPLTWWREHGVDPSNRASREAAVETLFRIANARKPE